MHQNNYPPYRCRCWWGLGVFAGIFAGSAPVPAQPSLPAPVQALREELRKPDPSRDELEKLVRAVIQPGDLRQALHLGEWARRPEERKRLSALLDSIYGVLIKRLEKSLREVFQKGSVASRLAALVTIGEMGAEVESGSPEAGLVRALTPDLLALLAAPNEPAVRAAGARALGQINPEPQQAVPVLAGLLGAPTVEERRAAAEALVQLVQIGQRTYRLPGFDPTHLVFGREPVIPQQFVHRTMLLVPVIARGFADPDAGVRRGCLEALHQVGVLLVALLPRTDESPDWALPRPKLGSEEAAKLLPLVRIVNEQMPAVTRTLTDKDRAVRLSAYQTLEVLARTHQGLRRVARFAAATKKGAADKPPEEPLLLGLRAAIPVLVEGLSDQEVRFRLAALYVLESLEAEAAPAAAALAKAATDGNPFVRWGVARALGKMAPREAAHAVPALARLLDDPNGDVRLTGAAALERYGPAARAAVPALAKAVQDSRPALREWAIRVVAAVGKEATAAVPALVAALGAPEASVRAAAAQALGKVGPREPAARQALLKALNDPDGDVRQAASDALLSGQ